jgi:hypothetical protein
MGKSEMALNVQLTWLLDAKQDEAGMSDLRAVIEAVGDRYLILSRHEVRQVSDQTLWLHAVPTLAYGSVEFCKAIRRELYPGRWCDWPGLRYDYYAAGLGALLLNDDYVLLPAGEVRRRQSLLRQQWGAVFLRPVRADKPFAGFVACTDAGDEIEERLIRLEKHDLVVVARAKTIDAEYRTVAVRGKGIIAESQYMRQGQLDLDQEVPPEVEQAAKDVVMALGTNFPDPMFVVDIALCQGQYRLLEVNSFSFSIFYACDLEAIVRAAHTEAISEWQQMQI